MAAAIGRVSSSADVAQLVEHHLAKVRVASSNLVVRSMRKAPAPAGAFLMELKGQSRTVDLLMAVRDIWPHLSDPKGRLGSLVQTCQFHDEQVAVCKRIM